MCSLQQVNSNRNQWESSSVEDDQASNNNTGNNRQTNTTVIRQITTSSSIQSRSPSTPPPCLRSPPNNELHGRLSLLPAYPSFDQSSAAHLRDHLLFANVPRSSLNKEQQSCYRHRHEFQSSFRITLDHTQNSMVALFFYGKYRELFVDLTRRLHVDEAILDYNYQRLLRCFDLMTSERIRYGFQAHPLTNGDVLPIHEYPIALEFFLQIDLDVFYMKTCSFRGTIASLSSNNNGIFCHESPLALCAMTACQKRYCRFCFPPSSVLHRTRSCPPVVRFDATQKHRFVSGYRSFLNSPATCQTKNILYVLTCPCGQYDYIGYTSMALDQRLAYHREHGNRVIHEFLLGAQNSLRIQTKPKSQETLVKDDMLLYKHSARCPAAIQLFLDCNPHYWSFIPMPQQDAQRENQSYELPTSIPADPSSLSVTSAQTRSDHEAGCCMTDLPPFPSNQYTFSTGQCVQQFRYFKTKQDYHLPNGNLDLYNALIIAVLPDNCSMPLYRLLEALFITHAQTKLNTLGHLENNISEPTNKTVTSNRSNMNIIADRGDWCRNLLRRPIS